eukprot:RCo035961
MTGRWRRGARKPGFPPEPSCGRGELSEQQDSHLLEALQTLRGRLLGSRRELRQLRDGVTSITEGASVALRSLGLSGVPPEGSSPEGSPAHASTTSPQQQQARSSPSPSETEDVALAALSRAVGQLCETAQRALSRC